MRARLVPGMQQGGWGVNDDEYCLCIGLVEHRDWYDEEDDVMRCGYCRQVVCYGHAAKEPTDAEDGA